jgi:hypothetical protein
MAVRGIWPVVLLLVCALPAAPATAQEGTPAYASASPPDNPVDASPNPGTDFDLGSTLTFDPAALAAAPVKPLRLPGYPTSKDIDISRADRADGSSSFTVKKPLPIDIDTTVGADVASATAPVYSPGHPLPGTGSPYDSGAAWASIGVPNLASIDARVDPNSDQRKLGTTVQHSMPVGSKLSITLQDTFAVTDTMNMRASNASQSLLAALPPSTPAPAQVWGNEQKLKFDILPTGTSLSGGVVTSSIDPQTHNSFSADQKLYGPLHVTTTVNDLGSAANSKSITASYKLTW